MATQVKNSITISREAIAREGLVILSLKEYQKLREQVVPTYYLKGKKAEELDKSIEEGLKEYQKGETISAPSLRKALEIYGGKKHKKH